MSSPIRSIKSAKSNKSKSQKQLNLNQISQPDKVRVLILTQQKLAFQQYYFLKNFTNIIKLDLSYNKINQFPHGFSFKNFNSLKTLFLHYNKFDKLKNLQLLSEVNVSFYFTLFGNPLQETLARHFCINIMPWLKLMDDKAVQQEQKYEGILDVTNRLSKNQRIGYPLIQQASESNSIQFLIGVIRQINIARQFYLSSNPIIKIQRWWKRCFRKFKYYRNYMTDQKMNNGIKLEQLDQRRSNGMKSQKRNDSGFEMKNIDQINHVKKIATVNEQKQFNKRQKQQQIQTQRNCLLDNQKSELNYQQTELKQGQEQVQSQQEESQRPFKNSQNLVHKYRILCCLRSFSDGFKAFGLLLKEQTSIFCRRQFCQSKGYKFKQVLSFKNKYLKVYRTAQQNSHYSVVKQNGKRFLSLVFYNNFHYLLQLKSKKCYTLISNKSQSQLKNTQFTLNTSNFNSISKDKDPNTLVQIDHSIQDKISLIKKLYIIAITQKTSFPILFGLNLLKISSAIKIQKYWKGYQVRKHSNLLKQIKQKFAARKIQKWVRNLKFANRQKFLVECFMFLKDNQSPNITMKLNVFQSLPKVYQTNIHKPQLFLLPFQDCSFDMSQAQQSSRLNQSDQSQILLGKNKNQTRIKFQSERLPFPSYFSKFLPELQLAAQKKLNQSQKNPVKIIDLLMKGCKSVIKFHSMPNSKDKYDSVLLQYHSKQQANIRKFLLCLFTFNFKQRRWVEFNSLKNSKPKSKFIDVNQKIKQTPFMKMIYDNDKKQKLYQKISSYTKQIKSKTQIIWLPMKMRYFQGTTDFSSIMITGLYKKYFGFQEKIEQNKSKQDDTDLNASRQRLKQLNSLKSLRHKIVLNNLNSSLIIPPQNINVLHTNRNTVSLTVHENTDQYGGHTQKNRYYQYKNNQYLRSLHSDQSQASLDWSQQSRALQSLNSYGSSLPLRRSELIQSHQKEYISNQAGLNIFEKKAFIQKSKSSHKQKLAMLTQIRRKKNQLIRSQYKSNQEQNQKLIKQSSNLSLIQNINKANKIKAYQKNKSSVKDDSEGFQRKFLRKGNISMKLQLKQFQKNRSRSNIQLNEADKNLAKKSSRYQTNLNDQKTNKLSKGRQHYKQSLKNSILKTELKQFSIQLSQAGQFGNHSLNQHDSYPDLTMALLNEHKRSKQLRKQSLKRAAMNSATSQKITKLYEQKKRQILKSEQSQQYNNSCIKKQELTLKKQRQDSIKQENNDKNQTIFNIQEDKKLQQQLKSAIQKQKRKLLKKKKVVHSVFPQQFFPLKDSQQIGFYLPKINK